MFDFRRTNFETENIPLALDSLPDGKYVRYYNKLTYLDGDTLKFIQNKIASIHYLKNNIPEGPASWFTLDNQIGYKKGNYTNGKREGVWYYKKEEPTFFMNIKVEKKGKKLIIII